MTRAGTVGLLHALASAAAWNLLVPAVIRPCREGWLIFMRGRRA